MYSFSVSCKLFYLWLCLKGGGEVGPGEVAALRRRVHQPHPRWRPARSRGRPGAVRVHSPECQEETALPGHHSCCDSPELTKSSTNIYIVLVGPRNWTKKVSSAYHTIPGETKGSPFSFFRHCATFLKTFLSQRLPLQFFDVLRRNGC